MIAGAVVALPRRGACVCAGCRRIVARAATVTLDLPDGSWVYVCWPCYVGEPLVRWGDVLLRWTGEGWMVAE
jgi:hypothetical protein